MANVGGRPTKYEYMKETRKLSTLKNWDKNPRSIKDKDFERLKTQIRDLGQYKPLLITEDGTVLGGNMRLRAYKELGVEDVWVSVVDAPTEEKKLEYALSDNDRAGFYDEDLLANLIPEYPDFEWENYAVDLGEPQTLDKLIESFKEVEEDEVPEVAEGEPESKLGEVYQLGRHRLMCGDATKIEDVEKLMDGQKADMVFTDPPYGMDLDTDYSKMPRGENTYTRVIGDDKDFDASVIFTIKADKYYIWGADWFYNTLPQGFSPIVWDKQPQVGEAGPQNHFELCWAFPKEKRRIIRRLWTGYTANEKGEKRVHPTQKPLSVCTDIIGKGEGIVVDLFGGSGSTLIACEQTNRTCYMMELDPKYCDVIRKRYDNFVNKTE